MSTRTDTIDDNPAAVPEGEDAVDRPDQVAAPAPETGAATKLAPAHFRVIALLMVSAFTVILNETTMTIALPSIMTDLTITETTGQWLTTAFMLTMAVVIPATGYLINRLGTRSAYILAMSIFTAGTLLGALAPTFGILVTARVVQAMGTGIMMPLLMTTIMTIVPPQIRGKVMGNITLVIALAPATGPLMSGVVVDLAGWRAVFGVVTPVAALALAAGILWVRDVAEKESQTIDPLSILLSLLAFGGIVWGLSQLGESANEASVVSPYVPLVVGVVMLGAFIWRQLSRQRTDTALLDLRTFRSGNFRLAVGIMAISMVAMFGAMILLPLVLQDAMGYSPTLAGLVVLPGGLAMGLLGPVVGRLYDKVGPRPLMVPGLIGVTASVILLATINLGTPLWLIVLAQLVLMVGLSFTFTPLFSSAMGDLELHLYSHGSAMINTVQQVAGAAGIALFVALMTIRSTAMEDGGASEAAALTGGARLSFTVGAIVVATAIFLATRIKRVEGGPSH
ncbi:MDR family MFS transporter [Myceligenerans pegani]|uniref:Multidrug efflux MFS transporter n=1 Tax=Myceligenerans pegani TaxID=2776917 RepID=A0ABR9N1J5_9MICO|nr:MDR family MFS transporter [Myceligenerans sp. TRM 65318]MBE1877527.1 multidrug efflux MFS transporter [Myceligenerans sp. TRM 65318]MBE3019798.1 multidrug efflux MFS transporter [Myceligenerans sp. TRM 65318]